MNRNQKEKKIHPFGCSFSCFVPEPPILSAVLVNNVCMNWLIDAFVYSCNWDQGLLLLLRDLRAATECKMKKNKRIQTNEQHVRIYMRDLHSRCIYQFAFPCLHWGYMMWCPWVWNTGHGLYCRLILETGEGLTQLRTWKTGTNGIYRYMLYRLFEFTQINTSLYIQYKYSVYWGKLMNTELGRQWNKKRWTPIRNARERTITNGKEINDQV